MASSNPAHVSNINDQHAVDATKLVASARNHLVYVESVVNTANVPQDAQEQVASRTLAWATQNQPHAKNNYLKFLGYTAMQGALHLLRTEIDLALNPDWRDTHEKKTPTGLFVGALECGSVVQHSFGQKAHVKCISRGNRWRRSGPRLRRGIRRNIRRQSTRECRPAASRRNARCGSWPM